MYISELTIKNYRGFRNLTVNFRDGINLIIGQNNSGKSNILNALALIFDSFAKKRLTIDDFNINIPLQELKEHSPSIIIGVSIKQSENEDIMSDDLVTVSNWLTNLNYPYTAKIQYEFFLPENYNAPHCQDSFLAFLS